MAQSTIYFAKQRHSVPSFVDLCLGLIAMSLFNLSSDWV